MWYYAVYAPVQQYHVSGFPVEQIQGSGHKSHRLTHGDTWLWLPMCSNKHSVSMQDAGRSVANADM